MSDGYDFFAGSSGAAPGTTPRLGGLPPGGGRFQPAPPQHQPAPPQYQPGGQFAPPPQYKPGAPFPPSPPLAGFPPPGMPRAWQPAQAPAQRRPPVVALIAAVVVVLLALGGAYEYFKPHPIGLPPTAGGLTEWSNLPASWRSEIDSMKKQMGKNNAHDLNARVYGDGSTVLVVVAAHVHGTDLSMEQVDGQLAAYAPAANVSTGPIVSGSTTFNCLSGPTSQSPMTLCVWWSNHSLLMGIAGGTGIDAQATADALAGVKAYAGLT
jgi:hypothetical protein